MRIRAVEISVGVFLLAGMLALLLLALRVSGLTVANSTDTYKLVAHFDNISGLTTRAKVTMAGVKCRAGSITYPLIPLLRF